jgi:hypothetical protein
MASKKCGVNGENENGSVMTIEEEMKMAWNKWKQMKEKRNVEMKKINRSSAISNRGSEMKIMA